MLPLFRETHLQSSKTDRTASYMEDVRDALLKIYSAALSLRLFCVCGRVGGGARVKRWEKCYLTRVSLVFQYQKKKKILEEAGQLKLK